MKENKITVIINKPVVDVFEFTTDPKNTHLWILSIKEEVSEEYPPKIGIKYKNRGDNLNWDVYKVIEIEKNKIFTLSDLEDNYSVRYTYRALDSSRTKMEYFEWMKDGELKNPFTRDVLERLKSVMENYKN